MESDVFLAMCFAGALSSSGAVTPPGRLLEGPLPALNDEEGDAVPHGLPAVFDSHVHLFPDPVFDALWGWFEKHGWPIRYRLRSEEILQFLFRRGVRRVVGLHYAHKPGLARELNHYVAELAAREPRLLGLATVFPGEPDAPAILKEAFGAGLGGVKMHCHVQCMAVDDPSMGPIFEACADAGMPMVIHAGREPSSPAYKCDPHELCQVDRVETILKRYPSLRLCVPHLGADEFEGYRRLVLEYDNLWLDTTMVLADYFHLETPWELALQRPDRIMYGSDFPNLPYAWDRELKAIATHAEQQELSRDTLSALLHGTASMFYGLET